MAATFQHNGRCDICEAETKFTAENEYFRDHLLCSSCGSIPRERALMRVIKQFLPHFHEAVIHESSPGWRGASLRLKRECKHYSFSHYFSDIPPGEIDPRTNARCEDIERLTFPDSMFDLFITQDVMEHVFDPEATFLEIARILKPGGMHIFTVPLVNKIHPTRVRASLESGQIIHHSKPQYHGNPVSLDGSLVTMDWGYDIAGFITRTAKTPTLIIQIDDLDAGIRAELIDVLVSMKTPQ